MQKKPRKNGKFACRYVLDERVDRDLTNLTQRAYRLIQTALQPSYRVRLVDGMPDPVQYYLLYTAALMYGASDATVTLVLHNLGREARLMERQVFEYWVRALYYASNPDAAKRALFSTPFREKQILDELEYDKSSKRYQEIVKLCSEVVSKYPDSQTYRDPSMSALLLDSGNPELTKFYALHYRVPSQMAHAAHAGVGGVWDEKGISFDSRLPNCNYTLEMTLFYVINFLELMNDKLELRIASEIAELRHKREVIERNLRGQAHEKP